jgi:hypothetical protein
MRLAPNRGLPASILLAVMPKEARADFGNGVVEKLIKSGVNPIARSKTELGSQCRETVRLI